MFAPPKLKNLKVYEPKLVPSIRDLFGRFADTETGSPLPVLSSKLDDIKSAEIRLKEASKTKDE